jgi:hypothetical protein
VAAAWAEALIASEAAMSLVPPVETAVLSDPVPVEATAAPPRDPPAAADPPAWVAVVVVVVAVAEAAAEAGDGKEVKKRHEEHNDEFPKVTVREKKPLRAFLDGDHCRLRVSFHTGSLWRASGCHWHTSSCTNSAKAGEKELLYRRVGANELDAIQICHGFVEAQDTYALRSRQLYSVNQYAQRIISTPGQQDGLTWQSADGKWEGPIGEKAARAIAQGYNPGESPYHGYFFKVLKGQGAAAPLGKLDYVIEGVMIGGFALVASPAEYRVTGVKTFMVSYDGVVYQKDLGPDTLEQFKKMERFNPDTSWQPVLDN